MHGIYWSSSAYPTLETFRIFLHMSKTFEKVWHSGFIYKLRSLGIPSSFYITSQNIFFSSYMYPLGFILGPTLFILHINDLPNDTYTLYSASDLWQKLELASELESDL